MVSTEFVFLNATGDHGLSSHAARQMRAHITRTNFAKRRQRIAGGKQKDAAGEKRSADDELVRDVLSRADVLAAGLPFLAQPQDPYRYAQNLSHTWSQVFLDGQSYPSSPDEAAWIALLASEPALLESSMAVGLRYWEPDASSQREARAHWSRAVEVIVERIGSGQADTDAVITAVATMAFGERLALNEVAWGVHIDGLALLLEQRHKRIDSTLPYWLYDMMAIDALNNVVHFPRFYHGKVIQAVKRYGYHPALDIIALCAEVTKFRDSLELNGRRRFKSNAIIAEPHQAYDSLFRRARKLQTYGNPSIRATSLALEIMLHISRHHHCSTPLLDLTPTATEMMNALSQATNRGCSFMDLTSCHLMLGAIAADKGSRTRAWFINKMRRAVVAVEARGWKRPLDVVEKGFDPGQDLKASLEAVWQEISSTKCI